MSLRRKIFLAIGLLSVVVLLAAFLMQHWILTGPLAQLEEKEMHMHLTRVRKALALELAELEQTTASWTRGDHPYLFIEKGDDAYLNSNLTDALCGNLRLNVIVFVDSSGHSVVSRTCDLHHHRSMSFLASLLSHLTRPGLLLNPSDAKRGTTGILTLPEGPLLVAALPISTPQHQGAARGTLVFGRFLDGDTIAQLGETLQLSLLMQAWNDSHLPDDFQAARAALTMATPIYTRPLGDEVMAGYTLLTDIYTQPALILRVTMPRNITQPGRISQLYLTIGLLVSGLLTYALAMGGLERLVLARLEQLARQVRAISEGRATMPRVAITGNDEIGTLEHEINRMLEHVANSAERFRALVEHSSDLILVLNREATIRYASPSVQTLLGYTPDQLVGCSVLDFVHPTERATVQEALVHWQAHPGAADTTMTLRAQHRNGEYRTLEILGSNLLDNPAVAGIVINGHDITERERAERALREREDLYRDLVEHSHALIGLHDLQGNLLSANKWALRLLGYEQLPASPLNLRDILAPEVRHQLEEYLARIRREGHAEGLMLVQTRAGEKRLWEYHNTLRTEGVPVPIVRAIAHDVTELKRVQTELQEANTRFFTLLEVIPDAVFLKDRQGRTLYVNKAYVEFVGRDCASIIGKCCNEFMPPDLAEQCAQSDAQTFQAGTTIRNEEYTTTSDGKTIWLETIKTPMRDAAGNIVGLVGISRDITERKRTEALLREYAENLEHLVEARTRQLREAQEQLVRQERLATLGQVAGSIAHELRSPLSVIKNAAYYLNMRLEHTEEDVREMLQILDNQVNVSARIIESLLDFARPRAPVLKRVHLPCVIEAVLEQCHIPAHVTLEWQVMPDLPEVLADAAQMQIVFRNLITNAIQAMPSGGRLTIGVHLENGTLCATISDTGQGIPSDALEKIFQPLYTTKAKGIGLGLALCKLIVEAHNGTIAVTSEVGKGSTFTVTLPAER